MPRQFLTSQLTPTKVESVMKNTVRRNTKQTPHCFRTTLPPTFLQLVVTGRHVGEVVLHVVMSRFAHQHGSGDKVCVRVDVCELLLAQHVLSLKVSHVLVRLGAQVRAVSWARHATGVVTAAAQLSQCQLIPRKPTCLYNRLSYSWHWFQTNMLVQ